MRLADWFILHVFYAFLGYVSEVVYCSAGKSRLVNRGFLYGPLCPIYGYGAVIILLVFLPLKRHWPALLLLGTAAMTALEYFTGLAMERLFNMKWWDYSHYKYNLHGRICLKNSLLFGVMIAVLVYAVHPVAVAILQRLPHGMRTDLAVVLLVVYFTDTVLSILSAFYLKAFLAKNLEPVGRMRVFKAKTRQAAQKQISQITDSKPGMFIYNYFGRKFPRIRGTKQDNGDIINANDVTGSGTDEDEDRETPH